MHLSVGNNPRFVFGRHGFTRQLAQFGFVLLVCVAGSSQLVSATENHAKHTFVLHHVDPNASSKTVGDHVNISDSELSGSTSQTPYVSKPGNVTICNQKDSAGLNKCLQQVLKEIRPRLADGIPEMSLPPLEPLELENVSFEQGYGAVKVASKFMSVQVSGLSNFTQSDFWVDVPKKTFDFDLIFPQLYLSGIYELSGNIFFLPIGGSGNFFFNLSGTRAKGTSQLSLYKNESTSQVEVKNTNINLEIETIKVHLTNLFNGDPLMGEVINRFLNENSQEVFEEIKPQIGKQVGGMMSLFANRALAALSTNGFDDAPFTQEPSDQH